MSTTQTPVYLVYANKDASSTTSTQTCTLLPTQHFSPQPIKIARNGFNNPSSHKSMKTGMPFQVIQISNPVTSFHNITNNSMLIDQVLPVKDNTDNHCSSSDSSDSESEGDQSSPKPSPGIQIAPPPLISTSTATGNIVTIPAATSQAQSIILPQGLIATGNGIAQTTQQILVPVTIPQLQNKTNILFQPTIFGPTQTTSGNLFQLGYPGSVTEANNHSIVQTLPLIVNEKQGDLSSAAPAVTNGQTFQVLTFPGNHQIVDQAR